MKNRFVAVASAFFLLVAMMAGTSLAHPDEPGVDHDAKYEAVEVKLQADFEVTPGNGNGRGNPNSNAPQTFAPCIRGMAADMFPCDGVDMLSFLSHEDLGTTFVNDIWGWTDPETKKDYALLGSAEGAVFVDISDPKRPNVQGILPTASTAGGDSWRDIKVYDDHAFVVSEHFNHGMQVFDLTELRDWDGTYTTYDEVAHYTEKGRNHNIAINEDSGYAYLVGGSQDDRNCQGGLHIVDITDPTEPSFVNCYTDDGYIHDVQCVIYEGPDTRYTGSELCFGSNENTVSVIDVTDKSDPERLAVESYPNVAYSHQGWLTPDQGYFLHGDELDEVFRGLNTTTRVWDVRDLENPELIQVFENDTTSIDHNIYPEGDYAYASNYTSGLRVYDIRDIADGGLSEVGYFDIYPENDNASFEGGTWSNYPWFHQKGIVAVSSMDRGMFVLQPRVGRAGAGTGN